MESFNLDKSGKHYMIDKKLIKYIVDEAMLLPNDVVLEIGCGHGELTREIAKKCKVITVDIEDNNVRGKNIIFLKSNILDVFLSLFEKYGFNKIIGNIPYNISEPLMRLIFKVNVETVLLTVGENFSKILVSKNNRISIIANELYNIEVLNIISPKAFNPMPRVNSALISIEQKDIDSIDKISLIYKELVLLDNKKLRNAVIKIMKGTKKEIKNKINSVVNTNIYRKIFDKKLYQLSNEEFILFDKILRKIIQPEV
ncbi:MAG: dimethyladenosine transferase [Candidatus Woesearchaeota archaeon]|nr:MAG: dimethyladenosine transferase [Candidatus Woesearchaeota archaeon]